jgi:iron complex transport system ATP-binding protein
MSLQLSDIGYSVGGRQLLADADLTLTSGTVTALIGPNGAGKTTLLRVASGELAGTGTVTLDGQPIQHISLEQRARQMAFLTQQLALDFPFKGHEVMQMGRIPHLTGTRHDRQVLQEVIDVCSLQDLTARTYTTLSGGEKQRIQIGRVLCQVWDQLANAYILFDEPTSALDLSHQLMFFELLGRLSDNGAAIALVVHDINLAVRFSDQVVLMSDGHTVASGTPRQVVTRDNIRRAFNVTIDLVETEDPGRPIIQAKTAMKTG